MPKKYLKFTILCKLSLEIRTSISRVTKNKIPGAIFDLYSGPSAGAFFFTFKEKVYVFLRSGIAYKFKRVSCIAIYYSKTKRHFKVRM